MGDGGTEEQSASEESRRLARRRFLQGAVAAGAGVAAWSAPSISQVPAYGLTTSTGTDGKCYYVSWSANGQQTWRTGDNNAQSVDSTTGYPTQTRTYTWDDIDGLGNDLVVKFDGSPQPHDPDEDSGSGTQHNQRSHDDDPDTADPNPTTITLVSGPPGCKLVALANSTYDDAPDDDPCALNGDPQEGFVVGTGPSGNSVVTLNGTTGTVDNVQDGTGKNYVIFDVVC